MSELSWAEIAHPAKPTAADGAEGRPKMTRQMATVFSVIVAALIAIWLFFEL